jgi:predicted RNA binding protein YcfA (HicA-like mRNA interferase family)
MPQIEVWQLTSFLDKNGYKEDRQSHSHLTLWNEERHLSVTIPIHGGCRLGRGLAVRILKDAGFTAEDFVNE